MKASVRHLCLGIVLVALAMTFPGAAFAGCGSSCDDISCVADEPTIGCVERFGFCWEVPCFAAAGSEGCSVDQALTTAFASFGDLTGEQALEKLHSDEEFAAEILPFLRVVGQDGEVFQGERYQRPNTLIATTQAQETEEHTTAEVATDR